MRIWVILGGMSAEREVSLESGRAVAHTLAQRGHQVLVYDLREGTFLAELSTTAAPVPSPESGQSWAERLLQVARGLRDTVEVAFLALHGGDGEGGGIQTLLSMAGIPFTGSGASASAVALDKVLSKRIMSALDIPTPPWATIDVPPVPAESDLAATPVGGSPAVVKPIFEGSSFGVGIAREASEWDSAVRCALDAARPRGGGAARLLVEKFIAGRELTVGVLGDEALPVVEIRPRTGFYDYARKYTPGECEYIAPAEIDAAAASRMQDQSLYLFSVLGCSGMARVDFRLGGDGCGYCLELNTIPGLTATSLLPKAASVAGLDFGGLLETICRLAVSESHRN